MSSPSASTFALVGKSVDGGALHFVESLGSGGFGVVYRAISKSKNGSNQQFAVKVVGRRFRQCKKEMQLRELYFHSQVSEHPNVVTFHRSFTDDYHLYFVFDACLGGDLFTAITEKALYFYDDALAKNAFLQIIDAVQFCHSKGIYHRDLKPENILCSADGRHLYLTDFGLATENNVSSTFGIGSSFYMSPECIRKDLKLDSYSPRHSDIWALGMILINMTTGRSPWRSAVRSDECFHAYLRGANFLRSMLPLSRDACTLIGRILVLNPLNRISLEDLAIAVLNINTFFMTSEELDRASHHVRDIVETYLNVRISASSAHLSTPEEHDICETQLRDEHPVDIDGQYAYASSGPDDSIRNPSPQRPVATLTSSSPDSSLRPPTFGSSALAVPSADPSTAPVTPETHPVADVDVTESTDNIEELDLPESCATPKMPTDVAVDPPAGPATKKPWSGSKTALMRQAMQKLRIM